MVTTFGRSRAAAVVPWLPERAQGWVQGVGSGSSEHREAAQVIPPCTLPIDPWAVGSGQGGTATLGPGREGWLGYLCC